MIRGISWFDNPFAMIKYCDNLKDFHLLTEARSKACYVEGEKKAMLECWIVLGEWLLDEFGQVSKITNINNDFVLIPKEDWPEIPKVVSLHDFVKLFEEKLKPKIGYSAVFGGSFVSPDAVEEGINCCICGKEIVLEDIPTLVSNRSVYGEFDEMVELIGDVQGMSINEVNKALSKKLNASVHVATKEHQEFSKETFDYFTYRTFKHGACHIHKLTIDTRDSFCNAVEDAGLEIYGYLPIENKYGSAEYNGPWYLISTQLGKGNLKLGWRKSVINIDYSEIDPNYRSGSQHTNGPGYEHVYSCEELTAALKLFINRNVIKEDVKDE